MNYLTKYNITLDEIENIKRILEVAEVNIDIFEFDEEKVTKILDLFHDIGVNNLYEIIITNPYMFYDTVDSIKRKIDDYPNKSELARLLNSDPTNLELIDLD